MEIIDRLIRLEEIEEIKRLKFAYCDLVDRGLGGDKSKLDELVDKFTTDAKVDFGELGVYQGREQIAAFYKNTVAGAFSFGAHMVFNPVIHIDGATAVGKWYVHAAGTLNVGDKQIATWTQAKYFDEYKKENGEWKFKSITVLFDFLTPFDEGWAKTKMIQLG